MRAAVNRLTGVSRMVLFRPGLATCRNCARHSRRLARPAGVGRSDNRVAAVGQVGASLQIRVVPPAGRLMLVRHSGQAKVVPVGQPNCVRATMFSAAAWRIAASKNFICHNTGLVGRWRCSHQPVTCPASVSGCTSLSWVMPDQVLWARKRLYAGRALLASGCTRRGLACREVWVLGEIQIATDTGQALRTSD